LHTNLAFCYTKKKAYEKAIKAADNAIEVDATNSKAFYRKAQAYLDQHKFEESTECFKQAIKLAPQNR